MMNKQNPKKEYFVNLFIIVVKTVHEANVSCCIFNQITETRVKISFKYTSILISFSLLSTHKHSHLSFLLNFSYYLILDT